MIKDFIKIDKEDVVQVVIDIVSDKIVQVVVCGVKGSPKLETDDEENSLATVKRLDAKEFLTLKVSYLVEESLLKKMCLYHRSICLERKLST